MSINGFFKKGIPIKNVKLFTYFVNKMMWKKVCRISQITVFDESDIVVIQLTFLNPLPPDVH